MTKFLLLGAVALLLGGCIYTSPPFGCPMDCTYDTPLMAGSR